MAIAKALLDKLADPTLILSGGLVDGKWCDPLEGGKVFAVTNPANGAIIATVSEMGSIDTRTAIDAAYTAQKTWAASTGKERGAVLRRLHDLVMANADDLATILTAEMGKPLAEAKAEILYGAAYFEWFAEEAKRIYGEVIPGHQVDKRIIVIKQPVGVVGLITPWNFPNAMLARKLAPALAVGCAVVAKPAEQTPLSAIALAVLSARAGLPRGLFNLITTTDGPGTGEEMCASDKLRKISFTGSTEVGRILLRQGADKVLRMSMELGGNAPFIVFNDADLDAAVEGAMSAKYRNAGQTCVCANRIYAQAGIHDEFMRRFARKVKELKLGDGFSDGVTTGPLIDAASLGKVESLVADALENGAFAVTGGKRSNEAGLFYEPTLLAGVTKTMKIAREEIFGPVAPLFKFDDVEDMIAQANDTDSGLAAYFYTRDHANVWRVAEALEYGMVGVNTGAISTEVAPFGGIKQSGQGREGSLYGAQDYLETKYLCIGGL